MGGRLSKFSVIVNLNSLFIMLYHVLGQVCLLHTEVQSFAVKMGPRELSILTTDIARAI